MAHTEPIKQAIAQTAVEVAKATFLAINEKGSRHNTDPR